MYSEEAWTLRKGDKVIAIVPEGIPMECTVDKVLNHGVTKQQYLESGMSEINATKYQYDGPSVLVDAGTYVILCRPDVVNLVMEDYDLVCRICKKKVVLTVPVTYKLHRLPEVQQRMIKKRCCGEHA